MGPLPTDRRFDAEAGAKQAPDPLAGPVRVRLVEPLDLSDADLRRWDALSAIAESANPFALPWMQRLALAHFDPGGLARLAVVEDRTGSWLGAIPLVPARAGRVPVRIWSVANHANQFTGTPLVRPRHAAQFWQELLGWLDGAPGGALALTVHNLPMDDPVNGALIETCARQGRRLAFDRRWQRAVLHGEHEPDALQGKLRRRIEGLKRKLEHEHGPLVFELTRSAARIAALVDEFVALENAGWKGAAGSALASQVHTDHFFREVARAAASRGAFEIGMLRSQGRVIAMSTQLIAGATVHGFKAAYDERFAAYAPGLLLLSRLTAHWQAQGTLLVDSCTRPGQEPVSRLWAGRRDLADCRVALGGKGRRAGFAVLLAAESAWHGIKRLGGFADKA